MVKKATILDIAKVSGYSVSTVSRALNNKGRINASTRIKILDLAKKLNYIPDSNARSLKIRRSNMLGLLISDITNVFYAEMAHYVQLNALEAGYCVIFVCDKGDPQLTKKYMDYLLSRNVDGIIAGSVRLKDNNMHKLFKNNFPVVLLNRRTLKDDLPSVMVDHIEGAYLLTKHLLNIGHRKIVYVCGPENLSPSVDRLEGYKKALLEYKINLNQKLIFHIPSFQRESGYAIVDKIINQQSLPDAVFAVNDMVALGIIDGLADHGLSVPNDIAVAGFDNIVFGSMREIKLTTVSQRIEEAAEEAIKLIVELIEKPENKKIHKKIVLKPKIIIRESCGQLLKRN